MKFSFGQRKTHTKKKNHVQFISDVELKKLNLLAAKKQIKNNQVEWQGTLTKINTAILMLEHWLIRFYCLLALSFTIFIWMTFRTFKFTLEFYSLFILLVFFLFFVFLATHIQCLQYLQHSENLWTNTQTESKMFLLLIYVFFAFLSSWVLVVISSWFRYDKPERSIYPGFVVGVHFIRYLKFHSTVCNILFSFSPSARFVFSVRYV